MSKLQLLRDFYDYNQYANERLLEVAGSVPADRLTGVIATMSHIVAAQINWLERWENGANKRSTVTLQESMRSLSDLRAASSESHAALHDYLAALRDAELEQKIAFRDSSGAEQARVLWQLLVHVANHGTYHRGEAAASLTDLGHSPGDIDFGDWAQARYG
jgi:uncharacterized damage-inducible protein DinB